MTSLNRTSTGLAVLGASVALATALWSLNKRRHPPPLRSSCTNIRSYLIRYSPAPPATIFERVACFFEGVEARLGLGLGLGLALECGRLKKTLDAVLASEDLQAIVVNVRRCEDACFLAVVHVVYVVAPAGEGSTEQLFNFGSWGEKDIKEPKGIILRGVAGVESVEELKHVCKRQIIRLPVLHSAFVGVLKHYHEQQLQEYSRYKNWRQSCYMEVHKIWSPQSPVTEGLYLSMKEILQTAKAEFAKWYAARYRLEVLEVETLNSFITKYIPVEGKSEFGKHIDGAKIDGSLILALPTDAPHDWPGLIVWDGPRDAQKKRPQHSVMLQPGDACFLDKMVWHHGLPITKGARFVMVCFYKCKWKKIRVTAS